MCYIFTSLLQVTVREVTCHVRQEVLSLMMPRAARETVYKLHVMTDMPPAARSTTELNQLDFTVMDVYGSYRRITVFINWFMDICIVPPYSGSYNLVYNQQSIVYGISIWYLDYLVYQYRIWISIWFQCMVMLDIYLVSHYRIWISIWLQCVGLARYLLWLLYVRLVRSQLRS